MIQKKRWQMAWSVAAVVCAGSAQAAVLVDLRDPTPAGPGDTPTAGEVLEQNLPFTVVDGPNSAILTASAVGGVVLANNDSMGVNAPGTDTAHEIEGALSESLTLMFDKPVEISWFDLSGVGANIADGAKITIGAFSIDLFTGATTEFNGSTDVYTPTTPMSVAANQAIVFSPSSGTASFGVQGMMVTIIPEPASLALVGLGALALLRRRVR